VISVPDDVSLPDKPCPSVAEFTKSHGLELLRFAYLLCGERYLAEDLLQDVLLAMHRRFPSGVTADNPDGYARRALANRNVSRIRRRASSEIVVDRLPERPTTYVDAVAERDPLWQALRRLPERQRTVLVLRYYADSTDEDIAAALDCRRATVRSLASRALATLRGDPSLTVADGGAS
jgi:RNA polymerase sigma-70 factor (sigma-E family)